MCSLATFDLAADSLGYAADGCSYPEYWVTPKAQTTSFGFFLANNSTHHGILTQLGQALKSYRAFSRRRIAPFTQTQREIDTNLLKRPSPFQIH